MALFRNYDIIKILIFLAGNINGKLYLISVYNIPKLDYNDEEDCISILKGTEIYEYSNDYIFKILKKYEILSGQVFKRYLSEANRPIRPIEYDGEYRGKYLTENRKRKRSKRTLAFNSVLIFNEINPFSSILLSLIREILPRVLAMRLEGVIVC